MVRIVLVHIAGFIAGFAAAVCLLGAIYFLMSTLAPAGHTLVPRGLGWVTLPFFAGFGASVFAREFISPQQKPPASQARTRTTHAPVASAQAASAATKAETVPVNSGRPTPFTQHQQQLFLANCGLSPEAAKYALQETEIALAGLGFQPASLSDRIVDIASQQVAPGPRGYSQSALRNLALHLSNPSYFGLPDLPAPRKAMLIYHRLAAEGDLTALTFLADMYANGHGGPHLVCRAYQLAERLYGQDPSRVLPLATYLWEGVGVDQDRTRALALLEDAIQAKHTHVIGTLADWHAVLGNGIDAMRWASQAAETTGDRKDLVRFGEWTAEGRFSAPDRPRAYAALKQSLGGRYFPLTDADRTLAARVRATLDLLIARMTDAEIGAGERLLQNGVYPEPSY